jgi:hypothetical protein
MYALYCIVLYCNCDVCMHACMYVSMYHHQYVCIYVSMYACMFVCMYVCIYLYVRVLHIYACMTDLCIHVSNCYY